MDRRDIVFFTGIQRFCKTLKERGYRIAILKEPGESLRTDHGCDFVIPYNPDNLEELESRLRLWPLRGEVLALINRRERRVKELAYLNQAFERDGINTQVALWTTDKYLMRKCLSEDDASMIPPFQLIDLKVVPEKLQIPFPVILKPRNLFKSQLITLCRNGRELNEALNEIRDRLDDTGLRNGVRVERTLVAEAYLDGKEATLDSLVDEEGRVYHSPPVDYIPARDVGIDDNHLFARLIPSQMDQELERALQEAAENAIRAIGIRRSASHIDLIINDGRAVILEIGTRIGGYRSEMMALAFGISLDEGNFHIAIGKKPDMRCRSRKAVAVLEFFPEGEGRLKSIFGLEEAKGLSSFYRLRKRIPEGENVGLAKQGYRCPLFVVLAHPSKGVVKRDMEKLQKIIRIEIE